jgi:ABC-type glutathione transport system ATPase component
VSGPPLLQAVDASCTFPGQIRPAVNAVSLAVGPADAIGVVGESGSGKTTLGRMLVGAQAPDAGRVEVAGRPWSSVGRADPLRRKVQMVFQNPYGALNPWFSARKTVREVFQVTQGLRRREADARAVELLGEVGLAGDALDRRPAHLSGGQCQRVGIARALACDPDVLVADEPTSALDVSVQAQILNLLQALRERRGIALVLISHDLGVVQHMTEQAVVMYRGDVVEQGPTERVFLRPEHDYTRRLIASIPGGEVTGSPVAERPA